MTYTKQEVEAATLDYFNGDELATNVRIDLLQQLEIATILIDDPRHRDIEDIDFLLFDQVEEKVKRPAVGVQRSSKLGPVHARIFRHRFGHAPNGNRVTARQHRGGHRRIGVASALPRPPLSAIELKSICH